MNIYIFSPVLLTFIFIVVYGEVTIVLKKCYVEYRKYSFFVGQTACKNLWYLVFTHPAYACLLYDFTAA